MKIARGERSAEFSVGELAAFRMGPPERSAARAGLWRAQVGTVWHEALRKREAAADPGARFEAAVDATWAYRGWRFCLRGRIDQLTPRPGHLLLREVKTVATRLPAAPEDLQAAYPDHFAQLAIYLALAPLVLPEAADGPVRGELVFVDIGEGVTQTVPFSGEPRATLESRLDAVLPFLESRWQRRQALREVEAAPPFARMREGQAEALGMLGQVAPRTPLMLFEAPTGFGKTGIALAHALRRFASGEIGRIVYLTGKSTGQLQVLRQLRAMDRSGGGPRCLQVRSRREMSGRCPLPCCNPHGFCMEDAAAAWARAGLDPQGFFETGAPDTEFFCKLAGRSQVCPYEIMRASLPWAEVWVGDYNYVFSPAHAGLFDNQPDFLPAQTLLIADEAQNLPQRAADALSSIHTFEDADRVLGELELGEHSPRVVRQWEQWADFLGRLKPRDAHTGEVELEAADLTRGLAARLASEAVDYERLSDAAAEAIWRTAGLPGFLGDRELTRLTWSARKGELRLTCLDAAPAIARRLRGFAGAILMSATLEPVPLFEESCGLNAHEAGLVKGPADWREKAYRVAIDARVDTRLRQRERYYADTARAVARLAADAGMPVAVFFPSYRYAEAVRACLEAAEPGLRAEMQPRGVSLDDQHAFIETGLLTAHALFLVLGSGFSEGIDLLGGRVERAMVVGPALPEVNPEQRARMEARPGGTRDEAFRRVYLVPGMRKVNQALGRLVRGPGQHAQVLLHCRRFAEEEYAALLAPEYQGGSLIQNEAGLDLWLREAQSP